MSKKKSFSGSTTMTLKDFHGGSIPSDLTLPSAPGVNARSLDRPGFDRYSSWVNPIGRFDSHLRPLSASRNFDDKTPFLSTTSRIGRTFDEDERKPLEAASSAPRRTVSDDSFYPSSSRVDLKADSYSSKSTHTGNSAGGSSGLPSQLKQMSRFQGASMAAGISKAVDPPGGSGQTVIRHQQQNAWAVRKEAAENAEMASSLLSGPSISSKLAQASALEKISSGRWQSKQTLQYHADVEVIHHENEPVSDFPQGGTGYNVYTRLEIPTLRDQLGATTMDGQMNKSLFVDGLRWNSGKDSSNSDIYGSSTVVTFQQSVGDGMVARPPISALAPDVSERPKLKLLPRTRPIESWELHRGNPISEEVIFEAHENIPIPGTELPPLEKGNQLSERPKLNLKPRSQPVDQIEGIAENRRNTLFGGARPRELVLRDRVADDMNPSGKAGSEKSREQQERERSPDTWRRPAGQQLRPCSPQEKTGAAALRHGKVASPAELAQSFSRPVYDPNRPSSGQLPDPGHPVLFSRLVGPTTRRSSINGY